MYKNLKFSKDNGVFILRADSERFGENEIIFQSPLESDLDRFLKENRLVIDFEDYSEKCDNLRERAGKELLGYWRMYFRGGWDGRWFPESNKKLTDLEIRGLDNIIFFIAKKWKGGCNFSMQFEVAEDYSVWGVDEQRYLVCPKGNDDYLVMIDTKYGNGDYPCRIYVYRDSEV